MKRIKREVLFILSLSILCHLIAAVQFFLKRDTLLVHSTWIIHFYLLLGASLLKMEVD